MTIDDHRETNEDARGETAQSQTMIPIYVLGKRYEVPQGLTIMKALEYAGHTLKRGCGCRGGACGACATVIRHTDKYRLQVGLACQTVAEPDTHLLQLPYVPAHKAIYDLDRLPPDEASITALYPELLRCMGCNTCTRSCPMDLEVMNYVGATLRGDWDQVVDLSMECLMCGMCAARCPAELAPFNIALLVRRMRGRQRYAPSPDLRQRLADISAGVFDDELQQLKDMNREKLQERFYHHQKSKGAAV